MDGRKTQEVLGNTYWTSCNPTPLSLDLDKLFESYLEALDAYTRLRAQLSKEFSSGFLALAQANRNSALGPGRRYGEEQYDLRAKAIHTLTIGPHDFHSGKSSQFAAEGERASGPDRQTRDDGTVEDMQGVPDDGDSPEQGCPLSSFTYAFKSSTIDEPANADAPCEPLKWFGILSPPSLRQCQAQFQTSIASTIPQLLTVSSTLNSLECQIRETRIALEHNQDTDREADHESTGEIMVSSHLPKETRD